MLSLLCFIPFTSIMAKSPDETAAVDADAKPLATFRHRKISAAVFENTGEKGTYFSVSVRKRYKPDEGDWQTTNSFQRDELPVLMELVRQAYAFILDKERGVPR